MLTDGSCDIIIGTQLVAKGHHFPRLNLVGVVDADLGLASGDPRAAERTFQILQQVTGRAGRGEKPAASMTLLTTLLEYVAPNLVESHAERVRITRKKKTGKKQETAKTRITKGTIGMTGSF